MADKILVIDDDPGLAKLVSYILEQRGLKAYNAENGQEGLKMAYELQPDLIILDIMMPEQDGFETCSRLREITDVPILMLTAKTQSSDVTRGFAVGADDYVKKPFSNEELVSRIETLLRRKKKAATASRNSNITGYSDGVLEIEMATQKVTVHGESVSLTPTEFNLLSFLIRHPHKTLSARTLLTEVWGDAYSHDKALLSLYIHQLRQKLKDGEAEHKYIQTQWGQGYWFNPLPQTQKPDPDIKIEDADKADVAPSIITPSLLKWWLLLPVLGILTFLILIFQSNNLFGIFSKPAEGSTSLDILMTADGFIEAENTGVRGQICVSNTGEYPTENLFIVDNVQVIGKGKSNLISTTVDINQRPILKPNETFCYPYKIFFSPILEDDVLYLNTASVTITNYAYLLPGSKHCPGPDPCSFGKTDKAEFYLPEN